MRDFKCAIFDLDGTLLDSTDVWHQVDEEFFAERGLVLPDDYAKIISPMGFKGAADYTIEKFSLKETREQVMAQWHAMAQKKFAEQVALKPYAKEYLEFLKNNGVRLCIATASHEDLFVPSLENNGILHLFDSMTTVSEVKRVKGFPDIYLRAAEKNGVPVEDCAVFEDIYECIRGAKSGGFYTVGVYDEKSKDDEEKIRALSDEYVYSFSELM